MPELIVIALAVQVIVALIFAALFVQKRRDGIRSNDPRPLQPGGAGMNSGKSETLEELRRIAEDAGISEDESPKIAAWRPVAASDRPRSTTTSPSSTPQPVKPDTERDLWMEVGRAFSPAAPVNRRDLFAGRVSQMEELIDVAFERGQHAVIYGERGVGKTSMSTMMAVAFSSRGTKLAIRVNCDGTDTFASVWRKVMEEIQIAFDSGALDAADTSTATIASALREISGSDDLMPGQIKRALQLVSGLKEVIVFLDEFDRLPKDTAAAMRFADLIKMLSDQLVPVTLVIIGVADTVDELISQHGSVERSLVQIHMPRMSETELKEIVIRGLETVEMTAEEPASTRIARISQGLPHFTHLMAQASARAAIETKESQVNLDHVDTSIKRLVDRVQESILESYRLAVASQRESRFEAVLLACALAPADERGFFAPAQVRDPLSEILGRHYDIPAFSRHLTALCEEERGPALQRRGSKRKFRYRFDNPLLQPYTIMKGVASGMVKPDVMERFAAPDKDTHLKVAK